MASPRPCVLPFLLPMASALAFQSACHKRLLQFRAGALHDVGPFRRFLLDEGRELLRRPAGRLVADLLIARFEDVRADCAVDGGVELIDDRARRGGWRHDAEPYRRFITGNAGLSDRPQVGESGRTLRTADAQRPDGL